jgi:hypothetical protein
MLSNILSFQHSFGEDYCYEFSSFFLNSTFRNPKSEIILDKMRM